MAKGDKLTPKQEMFIREYLVDLNATQAYLRAGYKVSENTAKVNGCKLLTNTNIQAAIKEAMNKRANKIELSADWVLERLKLISDRCVQGEPILDREGNETGEWKFDSSGANRSTELIGKHLGMFVEKHELNANVTFEIVPAPKPDGVD